MGIGVLVVVLLDQGRDVLALVARQDDRAQALQLHYERRFRGCPGSRQRFQSSGHQVQKFELFVDDGIGQKTRSHDSG